MIESIPPGKVTSYGQVAALAGAERNAREVGAFLKVGIADPTDAPWWRVLGAGGKIALHGNDQLRQRQRLEAEGVQFRSSGAVDGAKFWWVPEDPEEFFVGWGR